MTRPTQSLPLTGGDYFVLALDYQMRRADMRGNVCRLVVKLDGTVDAERLRAAIRVSGTQPWLANVRFRRTLPFLKPRWRWCAGNRELPVAERAAPGGWQPGAPLPPIGTKQDPAVVGLRPGRSPVAFDLVDGPAGGGTTLVLTWHHGIMDARGAELLLQHINAAADGEPPGEHVLLGNGRLLSAAQVRAQSGWWPSLHAARQSLFLVDRVSRAPLASMRPEGDGPFEPRNLFRLISFTREETDLIIRNGDRAGAGFRRSLFFLAASARALHAVRTRRGAEPAAFLVPVPQDLRRRGAPGPVFFNHVSFLFYRAEPEHLGSMKELVATLTRQMTEQIRDRMPYSFDTAMRMFQRLPLGLYARILRGPSRGRFATFFFSDTGESFRDRQSFLGARITDIAHLAPVAFPPGIALIWTTFQGRLNVVLSWVDGCLADDEVDSVEQTLRAELLGEAER